MNIDRILSLINSVLISTHAIESFDTIAIFDKFQHSIHVVAVTDYLNGHCDNFVTIKRVADFKPLGSIYLANPEDFIDAYPDSGLEKYISAAHKSAVKKNFDMYIAAYIHLYKLYKSLGSLTRQNYVQFVDSFIEYCMADGSDHQSTITYSSQQLYRVLRLRKAVFDMFKNYLNDYEIYKSVEYLHNSKNYSDKKFRSIKKKIRETIKMRKTEADDTADCSVMQPAA